MAATSSMVAGRTVVGATIKGLAAPADGKGVKPLRLAPPADSDECQVAPIWTEWGRLTRFLESTRLAFARERKLWASLELRSVNDVKLSAATNPGTYNVALTDHLAALHDEETLFASVLIHSYALTETAAADRLGRDPRDFRGIEDWGKQLLATNGSTWDSLKDGKRGVVEIAVVRNAFAHSGRRIDQLAANRLVRAGHSRLGEGDRVTLDYPTIRIFRGRLRDLMSRGGIGPE